MGLFEHGDVLVGHLDFTLLVFVLLLVVVFLLVRLRLAARRRLAAFLSDVALIGQDDDADVGAAVLLDFLEPTVDVVEALLVRQVEHHQDAVRPLVVRLGYCAVTLLTGRVPYLQTHGTLVNLQRTESEINAYRCHVIFLELIILRKAITNILETTLPQ